MGEVEGRCRILEEENRGYEEKLDLLESRGGGGKGKDKDKGRGRGMGMSKGGSDGCEDVD